MKLTQESATELVRQFKILEKYPKIDKGEDALVEAVMEARDEHDAVLFVKSWIRTNKRCPMPCDIYAALSRPKPIEFPRFTAAGDISISIPGASPAPQGYFCNQCEDSGWYIVQLPQIIPGTSEHYTAAKRCHHPLEHKSSRRW